MGYLRYMELEVLSRDLPSLARFRVLRVYQILFWLRQVLHPMLLPIFAEILHEMRFHMVRVRGLVLFLPVVWQHVSLIKTFSREASLLHMKE